MFVMLGELDERVERKCSFNMFEHVRHNGRIKRTGFDKNVFLTRSNMFVMLDEFDEQS